MTEQRSGLGFDIHPRGTGGTLWLAGVRFPGEPRLEGHSDGDVICHAVADALLGAAAIGDLGEHFSEADPELEGIAGLDLLARSVAVLAERGLVPVSCDATLIAESPRIAEAREEMRRNLAAALAVRVDRVSVKATRPEGLGLVGEGAGCLALATITPIVAS